MLLPTDTDYLARQERYKDLIREAERARLIRAAGHQYLPNQKNYHRLVDWMGAQMVKLGQKPQRCGCTSQAKITPKIVG